MATKKKVTKVTKKVKTTKYWVVVWEDCGDPAEVFETKEKAMEKVDELMSYDYEIDASDIKVYVSTERYDVKKDQATLVRS